MSGSVQVTIKGSVDETATQQTGTLAGTGALSVDIKDITKTSVSVDYKEQDKVKVSVTSEAPIKLTTDSSITPSGGINYDFLNQSITGKVGIDLVVSKEVAMSFEQSFNKSGNTISGKLVFSF
jgi:hypothetical protein